jgi:hypothetical protein
VNYLKNVRVVTAIAILVCAIFVAPAFFLDSSATITDRLSRAANVAQLVSLLGVALALPQLYVMLEDQRRTLRELSPRKLMFGLDGTYANTITLHCGTSSPAVGETFDARIFVYFRNASDLPAQSVVINATFPVAAQKVWVVRSGEARDPVPTNGEHPSRRRHITQIPHLNGGDDGAVTFDLALPSQWSSHVINITASCANGLTQPTGELTLQVRP